MSLQIGWFYWNPERIVFTLPWINHPVVWYGLWFVFGFIVGYFLLLPMVRRILEQTPLILPRDIANWKEAAKLVDSSSKLKTEKEILQALNALMLREGLSRKQFEKKYPNVIYSLSTLTQHLVDKLTWFVVFGTLIGARLGHVFLYDWPYYQRNPEEIFKIWKGGLASHGAAVGIILSMCLYIYSIRKQFPEFTLFKLIDLLVIPTPFIGACIRIGNFFNQEILGTASTVPWAVEFGDPAGGGSPIPRHPVQLYEAVAYLALFALLYTLWKTKKNLQPGFLSGLFFIILFSSRFFIEFLKAPQSMMIDESYLQTGQYLSLPFILLGIVLCIVSTMKGKDKKHANRAI